MVFASIITGAAVLLPHSKGAQSSTTDTERAIAQIAKEHVAVRFPTFDTNKNPVVVRDKEDFWEVEYELPKDTIGGTPVVIIDKATQKIIRSFHTQ
jgi:hypothetical protein